MTRLAVPGKCGDRDARGLRDPETAAWDRNSSEDNSVARPSDPKPIPERRSSCRRVNDLSASFELWGKNLIFLTQCIGTRWSEEGLVRVSQAA